MEMRLHSESNGKEREKERIGVIFHGGHWADLFMSEVNWTGGNASGGGNHGLEGGTVIPTWTGSLHHSSCQFARYGVLDLLFLLSHSFSYRYHVNHSVRAFEPQN